jgi:PadR family transcriptional regulator, regulatory protein AphA
MSPKRKPQLSIEHALLGFIQEQPLHGYEIHQRLQAAQQLGLVWHLKQAHLYALLSKLEADGLIAAEVIPQDARPPKRLLHLTEHGRAAFDGWVSTPVQHGRDLRIEFLAKLFWAQQRGAAVIEQLIASQREECRSWLRHLQAELEHSDDTQPYAALVLEFRRGQINAMLDWLDSCEAAFAAAMS